MNISCAHRQLETQELLSLLTAIDRTMARIRYFRMGAWHLPGVNDRQPLENVPRQDAECDRRALSEISPFHSQPDSAEAHRNNG